jgi:hypothetical protein
MQLVHKVYACTHGNVWSFEVSMYLRISFYATYVFKYMCKYQHVLPSVYSSVPTAKCEVFVWLDFVSARKAI